MKCLLISFDLFPGTPLTEKAIKDKIADPEAYLYRYMVKIDKTYLNKLLRITPYLPRFFIKYLNKPAMTRKWIDVLCVNFLHFMIKRTVEPAVFLFVISRSLQYHFKLTIRTLLTNWKSALSKLISNYLGKGDLEYDQKLMIARREMPELFGK